MNCVCFWPENCLKMKTLFKTTLLNSRRFHFAPYFIANVVVGINANEASIVIGLLENDEEKYESLLDEGHLLNR